MRKAESEKIPAKVELFVKLSGGFYGFVLYLALEALKINHFRFLGCLPNHFDAVFDCSSTDNC
jgi:hypothetical protein